MNTLLQQKKVQFLIILFLTVLAYSNIFQNQFVLDDSTFVTDWEQIRSFKNVPDLLMGNVPPVHKGVYRPIRSLLYLFYYHLFGVNPVWWHLHSLLVHLFSTVLVFLIVEQICKTYDVRFKKEENQEKNNTSYIIHNKSRLVAFITSLLFGLHPIHTEAITYIAASMEMTGVVFFFASFFFYLKATSNKQEAIRRKKLPLSLLSYLFATLAFFTYEMTLTLPLLILLYEFTLGRFARGPATSSFPPVLVRKDAKASELRAVGSPSKRVTPRFSIFIIPYFLLATIYAFIRVFLVHATSRGDYLAYSFYHTMLTMIKVFIQYMQLLMFPYNISYLHELVPGFDSWMTHYNNLYSILSQSLLDPPIVLGLLVIAGLLGVAIVCLKRLPLISFCILWFFISLFPVSYIFPQGIALAEKYLYIPSFGFVLLTGYVISKMYDLRFIPTQSGFTNNTYYILHHRFLPKAIFGLVLIISSLYLYLTFTRNMDWKDSETFWLATLKEHPKSSLASYTLGTIYSSKHDNTKALEFYQKTIQIEPRFWEAHFNLGNMYFGINRFDEAKNEYEKVLTLNPGFLPAAKNLSDIQKWKLYTGLGIVFRYPEEFTLTSKAKGVFLEEKEGKFSVDMIVYKKDPLVSFETVINSNKNQYGVLQNKGLAQIPNFEFSYVYIWEFSSKSGKEQAMQFFLLKANTVIEIFVRPSDSSFMQQFNSIIETLTIS